MPNKTVKTIIALTLLLAVCLSLTACGSGAVGSGSSGGPASTPEVKPEFAYVSEFSPLVTGVKTYISPRVYTDDGFYATSWEKTGQMEIPEGVVPEYEGQYDIYKSFIYFISNNGSMDKLSGYVPSEPEENTEGYKEFSSGSDLNGLAVADDGSIAVLEYVYTSWFDGPEGMTRESEDYWEYQQYRQTYYLRWLESDGTERSRAEVAVDPDDYLDASRMKLDNKGNVLVPSNSSIRAIAPDGTQSYTIEAEGYIDGLVQMPDGTLAVILWSDMEQKQLLCLVNTEDGSLGESVPTTINSYNTVTGDSQYDLYYTSGVNLYGYKLETDESTKLFSWLNCDVDGNSINGFRVAEDGSVSAVINNWEQDTETYDYELITVKKVPYDSVPHKEIITMAAINLDYQVIGKIVEFNRSNDKYRIEVTDYSEYNDYTSEKEADQTAGQTKLNTEIMAGNIPDIFCLAGLNYSQLAAKGILEDLYPYIDNDPDMSRDDFFPNVMAATEVDGKLCATFSNFYISTVIGASSVVGTEPGWTYDQFNKALASMPEGCTAFDVYTTRADMLQSCLALDMDDFVNWGTGECRFDSQQFIDLLEFSAQFPAEFDWDNYEWTEEDDSMNRLAQGKQMLAQTTIYSLDDLLYNDYAQYLGGSITYVGFPSNNGTGNMLGMTDGRYAMSAKSTHKDAVWQFMRMFFAADYQEELWGLPSNKKVFEEKAKEATTIQYQKDADGNYLLDDKGEKIPIVRYSIWNEETGKSEDVYAVPQELVEQVIELINTTDKVANYDSSIFEIVNDQAKAFFEGQKSAQDVAKLIQSKANIFVNEQR